MGRNKGPNSTRPKRNPRYNRRSRGQRVRQAKKKEALLKLHNEQQIINESLQKCPDDVHGIHNLPVSKTEILKSPEESSKLPEYPSSATDVTSANMTKTGILGPSKQSRKKLSVHGVCENKSSGVTNSCRPKPYPTREAQLFRRAKEKALWKLCCKQITDESFQDCLQTVTSIDFIPTGNGEITDPSEENTNSFHSFQDCSQKVTSKDFIPARSRKIHNPAEENSSLSDYLPLTTVVNSVPVTRPAILGSSKKNQKKLLIHGICRNKSSGVSNRCRPRSFSTRKSKAQRLRHSKKKEALMEMCGEQVIDKSFQDSSQAVISMDSMPSRIGEILNPSEENEKYSDISQKITIIDSVSVIKTEILDPYEINNTLIFQNYSQCATTMGSIPIVKTEILDLPRKDKKFPLLNVKVEQTQISKAMDETSRIEGSFASNINNKNSSKMENIILETCPKAHLLPRTEYPFIPGAPGSFKTSASPKKKKQLVLNHTVNRNKIVKKNYSPFSRTVCSCLKKIAMRNQLSENDLEVVKQDYANQLCLCKVGVHSLPESMEPEEKLMKTFCLENPEFGKITCNMKAK